MRSLEITKIWQGIKNSITSKPATPLDVTTVSDASPELLGQVQPLLNKIPADDYGVWFEVGCALKHLGISYDVFRSWSATSDKFDEAECIQKWKDLPEEPRAGWTTLRKYAGLSSFVPIPEQMLPEPQTEDECVAQAAHYLATTFKPYELFEICEFEQKPNAKKPVPKRDMNLPALSDEDTEEALCNDETLLSWILGEPFGGAVVSINPLKIPDGFKGYAPTDECVSDHRLVLVEGDVIPIKDQWAKLKLMRLPIKSIVNSAGKSLHVRCFIDAGNDPALYKERVNKLYEYVRRFGFIPDENCKNASRQTRLPGPMRDGKRQYLVCGPCGYPNWETFEVCELSRFNPTTMNSPSPIASGKSRNQHVRAPHTATPSDPEDQALHDELEKEFGEPLTFSSKGMVVGVNEPHWAAFVMRKRGLIKISGIIWRYEQATGLWLRVSVEELNNLIAKTAREYGAANNISELVTKFNEPTCNHVRKFMKSAETDLFRDRQRNLIHVANGMVEPHDDGTLELKQFSPVYYSRNQSEIMYDPTAQCPMFKERLLGPMLPQDDIEIIQRYGGQCLLGYNPTQTFLTLTGTAGGGKGNEE